MTVVPPDLEHSEVETQTPCPYQLRVIEEGVQTLTRAATCAITGLIDSCLDTSRGKEDSNENRCNLHFDEYVGRYCVWLLARAAKR